MLSLNPLAIFFPVEILFLFPLPSFPLFQDLFFYLKGRGGGKKYEYLGTYVVDSVGRDFVEPGVAG